MEGKAAPSLIIGAPASGSGKTTLTLAILRALHNLGHSVSSYKIGPDYIDPVFHRRASNHTCYNIDPWAMSSQTITDMFFELLKNKDIAIGEGVMGLFDGAQNGSGSTADVSVAHNIPIVLVVDAKGQAASVAALLTGFNTYREDVTIAGVIFNKVGGPGHVRLLREAAEKVGLPLLGCIPKSDLLALDHRHLGLVQARETVELEKFLDAAAGLISTHIDLLALFKLARPVANITDNPFTALSPIGQHIAVAEDDAFSFIYPHVLEGWKNAGAALSFFSPLDDEAPSKEADAIFLPGGYPELHCEKLGNNSQFKKAMTLAAASGAKIYGECGGFMTLGDILIDKEGHQHQMLGLLPVTTSFAEPKLHLGYRNARLKKDSFLGPDNTLFKAHEFHYAHMTETSAQSALFDISNARDENLGTVGAISGNVAGSFIHLIDKAQT
ncbi:cobyrinate a,c-diamide synthase [Sneathiella marina]|uniref:Cobyrinate a,c-diamide synthase n=1 Tax=Sneathiella marina TaxID=2950108 RepID=A0ABY4W521_9PROT|nr:cobyrinate a,c-diamide synthase [Sneathiella marina]USG62293.1 cobyrinate a,c-diamide synthase [Sneathiella marina]